MNDLLLRFAKHWIAGETAEDALLRARKANDANLYAIINLLGESATSRDEIEAATKEYSWLLGKIKDDGIRSTISVKPTQLGLSVEEALYFRNVKRLAEEAEKMGNFVWIDMEGSTYTQATIETYLRLRGSFDNVGVCVQAYLKRTEADLVKLVSSGGRIRLCKGAYRKSPAIAFKSRREISANFSKLMRYLFAHGEGFAIATHDDKLIREAIELSASYGSKFEFQMLLGVRDSLKAQLVSRGMRVSEYIPYGRNWLPYSVRRLRERKRNILLLLRSLISA